jgi:tubulin--tyrosine ligase
LIEKRKFDMRVFGVAHILNGPNNTREFRGYFFREGYLRTSSREYNINDLENRYIHLTNDAIQKKSADYGKFESGNKISYDDFADLLKTLKNVEFYKEILP